MGIISLLVLVVVLVIGFVTKINMGFLAIATGFALGHILGLSDSAIIAGFNTNLFVLFIGTGLLFGIALSNGTMDLLSRKMLKLTGKQGWFIPLALGIVCFLLGITGAGNMTSPMFTILAITLAMQLRLDPIAMSCIVMLTTNLSCVSAVCPMGLLLGDMFKDTAYAGDLFRGLMINTVITMLIFTGVLYFMCKPRNSKSAAELEGLKDLPSFNKNQYLTLLGIIIAIAGALVLNFNFGLISAAVAIVLLVLKVEDDKAAIRTIPFGQFITICGVSVLMKVVYAAGGIDIVTDFLVNNMNRYTAVGIMALAAGILSWFSSALAVTVPTLAPIALTISEKFNGEVPFVALVSAIAIGAYMAAFSPMSTSGGLILSNYCILAKPNEAETNKLFIRLFLISVAAVILTSILGLLGVYNIFA